MKILRYDCVTSTNDVALQLAGEGAEEWTVVVANEQSAGRGRRGAGWLSPPGENLYTSVILRPYPPLRLERLPELSFITSIAVATAMRKLDVDALVKWPNDVVVRDKKIAGVLVEGLPTREMAVVGIGVNVNWFEIPEEIAGRATSVAMELGHPVEIDECLRSVLHWLDNRLEFYPRGTKAVIEELRSWECTTGKEVRVARGGEVVTGTAVGIDDDGGLLVRLASGETIAVTAVGALIEG